MLFWLPSGTLQSMYFTVIREQGSGWDSSRPLREQASWEEHAAYMDALAEDGAVLLAGPLGAGEFHRALIVFDAPNAQAIAEWLEADPWTPMRILATAEVEPWEILIGDPVSR